MPVLMPISQEISLTPQEQFDLIARYPNEDPELSYTAYTSNPRVFYPLGHCAKPDRTINVLRYARAYWKKEYGVTIPTNEIELVCTGFWSHWGDIVQCYDDGTEEEFYSDVVRYKNTPEFPLPARTLRDHAQNNPEQFEPYIIKDVDMEDEVMLY